MAGHMEASSVSSSSPIVAQSPVSSVDAYIASLQTITRAQLRGEWRRMVRGQQLPPDLMKDWGRDLVVRILANRAQENLYGKRPPALVRELNRLAKQLERDGGLQATRDARPKVGTRLVRRWHDVTYQVTVTEEGYSFDGKVYSSLTPIARTITGAHWSGPRFFGLVAKDCVGKSASSKGFDHNA
jgi:Protein of unknown function (DUF2924)